MSSDYFIGSTPATPRSYSKKELDALYNNMRMETVIDSAIISRENSDREMLISSRPQSGNDITCSAATTEDGAHVLGVGGDVIIGIQLFYLHCRSFFN